MLKMKNYLGLIWLFQLFASWTASSGLHRIYAGVSESSLELIKHTVGLSPIKGKTDILKIIPLLVVKAFDDNWTSR